MAGLIELQMKDPLKTDVGGADAYQVGSTAGVDATTREVSPEETVSGQVDKLLKAEGPLMTQAVTGATQAAKRRGLINSTMAVTAGQDAAMRSVLPIASQDAQTYTAAASENMAAKNNAAGFNAGAVNDTSARNAAALNDAARVEQQGDVQARIATLQGQIQTGLIGETGRQTRMTDAQRAQAEQELARLQGQIQSANIAQQGAETRLTQAQGIQGQKDIAILSGEINKQLQQLKGDQATNLTNIEANYKQLIQTSSAASDAFKTAIPMLSAVMANTDTTPEQKQQAVDRITQLLEANLSAVAAIGNVDSSSLLDFT